SSIAARSVVLARSDSFADALAGTPLAWAKGAPLLLTGSSSLDARTATEITRVLGSKGTVYVLGGTSAISDDVATSLSNSGYTVSHRTVTRYAIGAHAAAADASATPVVGSDNPDTSRKVAERFFVRPPAAAIANQGGFADALSGGLHAAVNGAPLLFTDSDAL